jgi:hypothetical protein
MALIKHRVADLDAAEVAGARLGLVLRRGQTRHHWYGRFMNDWNDAERAAALQGIDPATFGQCDHALVLADAKEGDYEIGLRKAPDGNGYLLLYDAWGPGQRLEAAAGKGLARFVQENTAETAQRYYARRGLRLEREQVGGKLRLKVRV